MTFYGAEPASLRQLAVQFDRAANNLETTLKPLQSQVNSHRVWQGPDADRFRSEWANVSRPRTTSAVDALRQAADALRRNADEQEHVSNAGNGEVHSTAPVGTSELYRRIHNDDDSTKDGMHVEKVTGPDGKTRFIVYFDGTATPRHEWWRNIGDRVGLYDKDYVLGRIDSALRESGYDPDGNPKPDMMLVGFSQGGMEAQSVLHENRYHITDVVTYGAPLIYDDKPGINTIHLRADGDNVPGTGNAPTTNVYQTDPHTDASQFILGKHGDPSVYTNVGQSFDDSKDPALVEKQKSLEKFQGASVEVHDPYAGSPAGQREAAIRDDHRSLLQKAASAGPEAQA
ncbi:WXG100 family type VII secretion target [Mycolicibacterium llatzerense]|uniref:WXG100 family type VII secretion target n=1 Tax=Mycolicibacterium llatzerense TaxID=280871 RepID=UPI0021B605AA|nr:WXG100 family type VII secretion target [Mycolicibacterium llatzerense]MCT7363620.1 hypothetical protein [Mycolicibacterium llatzerense]